MPEDEDEARIKEMGLQDPQAASYYERPGAWRRCHFARRALPMAICSRGFATLAAKQLLTP